MKILLLLTSIILLFRNVYSQCPSSHPLYINGFGCTNNNNVIKTSFCSARSDELSMASIVRLSQSSDPTCASGETQIKSQNIGFTTQLTLYFCYFLDGYFLQYYYMIGGCMPGDTVQSTLGSVTINSNLRYVHAVLCANFDVTNSYIESSSSSQPSQSLTNQCGGLSPIKYSTHDILSSFTCPAGYSGFPCTDINECSGANSCRSPSSCENLVPGYRCNCPSGYKLSADGFGCDDIDECSSANSCRSPSTCQNTAPGYICNCPLGYKLSADGFGCDDIDECSGANSCRSPSTCQNTVPGYKCNCPSGYKLSADGFGCEDIDECSSSTLNSCKSPSTCQNTVPGYKCNCPSGYKLSADGFNCDDIDECSLSTLNSCKSPSTCQNTVPGYKCNCPSGYKLSADGFGCEDIDECSSSTLNSCKSPSTCQNSVPGYKCNCPSGYKLSADGFGCDDIDECSGTNSCKSPSTCQNTAPGYKCNCPSGYTLSADGFNCDDINECTSSKHDCQAPSTCQNSLGSFTCLCNVPGYELDSTKKKCIDINECLKSNKCTGLSTCVNKEPGYECSCQEDYHSILNGTDCAQDSDILISTFEQKPNSFYTFTLNGKRFPSSPVIKVGNTECNFVSGNDTFIECSTSKGIEVIGEVFIEDNEKASNVIQFAGAPFISNYSPTPLTQGSTITLDGRNLPTTGLVLLKINSIECPIVSLNSNQIVCNISEGSGINNKVELSNELVSNTDVTLIKYSNPFIDSTSKLYSSGTLTIYGSNFGTSKSKVTVNVGKNKCQDIVVKSHNELTCVLLETSRFTQIIDLVVDGLEGNVYYFTLSELESGQCESNCNDNGKCTDMGCECYSGFSGISCNETSGEIITTPPIIDKPIIDINNSKLTDYGYRVSIVRIDELDILDNVTTSINLLKLQWSLNSTIKNKWIYNIELPNKSLLECTFEYFKSATKISFASTQFQVPDESLKLSFKTENWPFKSKLNSLRIVVETNTTLLDSTKQCSINQSPSTYYYNQNLWIQTENSQSGITARFIKYATIDDKQIIANVNVLESSRLSSLVGIILPYFRDTSIVDPDFSSLLNVGSNKKVGNCGSNSPDWKVATGASIGAVVGVSLVISSVYFLKTKKINSSLINRLKNINNQNSQ